VDRYVHADVAFKPQKNKPNSRKTKIDRDSLPNKVPFLWWGRNIEKSAKEERPDKSTAAHNPPVPGTKTEGKKQKKSSG